MKTRVLYISYTGLTEPLGQSQVLNYLIGLSDEYEFHILSVEKDEDFQNKESEIEIICKKNKLFWHPIKYHRKPPGISTFYDILNLKRKAVELNSKFQFKMVHCRSYIPGLIGLHLKRKYDIPFLFDMRGFWVDERVEGNLWNLKNPIYHFAYKFFKKKEIEFFTESDHIVSLTLSGKEEIESWNIENSPISYIPTCVDLELFNYSNITEETKEQFRKKIGVKRDNFLLTYLGTIGSWYLTKEMLLLFKEIQNLKENSKFLFLTRGEPALIYDEAKKLNISKNDLIVTSANRNEVPVFLSVTYASVLFYRPTFSKKGTAPTKLGELMGMGIPVVANEGVGDVKQIIEESEAGVVINVENMNEYTTAAQTIISMTENPSKKAIRLKSIEYFDLNEGIRKYKKIYKKIIK